MTGDRSNQSRETINPTNKQRMVMLVDDSEVDRAVYRRYLEKDGEYDYHFVEVETGEAALKIYPQSQPDIILLDYLLPDMDGLEWLSLWQHKYRKYLCPVIVLTGQGDESIAVQFLKLGAADYLVKSQITAEKLKLNISKEIAAKKLRQEREDLIVQLTTANKKLESSNRKYQQKIAEREKYIKIIANVPAVIYAKNVDRQTQQAKELWLVNQEFHKIFALAEADIIGKTDRELFPPQIVAKLSANDRLVIKSKQPLTTEEEVYHADGKLHTYLSLKFPLFDDHREVTSIVGISTDITQEKQAQTELLNSEIRFRNTFEQAAVGMAHVSLDGKWLMVNQKLCEIVRYTKEELLQTTFQDITHPEDLATDVKYVRQMLTGEIETYSLEKRYIRKDNSSIWINLTVSLVRNSDGEPDYFISVIEDISGRKNLELSQQKTLKRLSNLNQIDQAIIEAQQPKAIAAIAINNIQQLLACQRVSIVTFDLERQTATILLTQGRAEQMVGEDSQTTLDVWQDLIDKLQMSEQNYIVVYLSQLPRLSATIPVLARSGLDCFIAFPLRVQNKLLGILKLWVEDINAITSEELTIIGEISTQEAIALQQAHLIQEIQNYALDLELKVQERTAQLEDINQELKAFSYSISHDLKAPLRAIQGFAIALQEDYGENLDDLGREYTERLAAAAQHMEKLIQDLLAYSRLSRANIQKQSVSLALVIDKALEELDAVIEEAQAEISIERPLLNMLGNRTILQQIIINLLSNAIKFVFPNVKPQIRIWTELRKNYVRLWIEDNAIGIEPQHQKRIFQVFERLHGNEAYPGTGIGLAIVKKGIERLGGRFGLESKVNRGSRFWLELPAIEEDFPLKSQ